MQVWSKYTDSLEKFRYQENSVKAVECLNDLVTNALGHIPDVIEYMSALQNQSVFNFCAIPQVNTPLLEWTHPPCVIHAHYYKGYNVCFPRHYQITVGSASIRLYSVPCVRFRFRFG